VSEFTGVYKFKHDGEEIVSPTINFMPLGDEKITKENVVEHATEYIYSKDLDEIVGLTFQIFHLGLQCNQIKVVSDKHPLNDSITFVDSD
jgi:hypothetical protein|tara:strand:- start:18262 stop:18531 length:270 start_codon:yes stop_codon:yes gene_type:complete